MQPHHKIVANPVSLLQSPSPFILYVSQCVHTMQNPVKPNRPVSTGTRGFDSDDSSSLPSKVSVGILAVNTFVCAFRAREDPYTLAFIFSFYALLLLLFWSLDLNNRLQDGSPRKERVKLVVWVVTTLLIAGFAYRVEKFLGSGWSWALWGVMGFTSLTGFIFVYVFPATVSVATDEKPLSTKNVC